MMWEAARAKIKALGGKIEMGCKVVGLRVRRREPTWNVQFKDQDGNVQTLESEHVISSAPMRELVNGLQPAVSERAKHAANSLKYRDFLTVMLILKNRDAFEDNWIYIHDPKVKVGRIQNFRSWSPEMVPDPDMACYGLEYFCFEHDGLWDSSDEDLIELAKKELMQIGLAKEGDMLDGTVVRQKKAYPVYDDDYAKHVNTIRERAGEPFPEPAPGRPQRHAQVQQPGSRHDDGDAVRGEHPGRHAALRSLAGERGRRVPRSRRSGRRADHRQRASSGAKPR